MCAPRVMGRQTTNAILTGVTAILCMLSCSTARVPVAHMGGAFGESMSRQLQQEQDPVAFLDLLAGEDPAEHLAELYVESGSTEPLELWLLEAAGYASIGSSGT